MSSLATWTLLVDLVALGISLWLGIYIVTRSPRSTLSWLAGLTLWSLSGYFLDSFLHLSPPGERVPGWWTGWTILFSAPLWLHLTTRLCWAGSPVRRILVWAAYTVAAILVLMEQSTSLVFGLWTRELSARASAQQPGLLYPLVCTLLIASPLLALLNLYQGWRLRARSPLWMALRRQLGVLMLATALAVLSGVYLTMSVWLALDAPLLWGQLVLAAALALLGYGVARYDALIEGRASLADFSYSLAAIVLVAALYALVTYLSYLAFGISLVVFTFVMVLVIVTHSVYEWGGVALERLFRRRRVRDLRADMRGFTREAEGHDMGAQLAPMLGALCDSLGIAWGWIAVRHDGDFEAIAVHPVAHRRVAVPASELVAESITPLVLSGGDIPPGSAATLVPLCAQGRQVGSVVLGERVGGRGSELADPELEVIEVWADQVASVIWAVQRQDEAVQRINVLVSEFRQRERDLRQELRSVLGAREGAGPGEVGKVGLRPLAEDALRHLYDYAYLGEHGLAQLGVVSRYVDARDGVETHLDRGRALSQLLVDVIGKLRPPGPEPRELTREWVQYTILHDAYVRGELNRDIMGKLYISESTFNRARRRAVRGVTRALGEMEQSSRAASGGDGLR